MDREVKLVQGIRAVKEMDEKLDKDYHALVARDKRLSEKKKALSQYEAVVEGSAGKNVPARSTPTLPERRG